MLDKLEAIKAKFDDIGVALTNPEIVGNNKKFSQLSKEYRSLEKVVNAYTQYKRLLSDIDFNREALMGDDEELRELAKMETAELEQQKETLEKQIRNMLIPKDPQDDKNAILEIRAGTGGDEASLFAGDLLRMYMRYCEGKGIEECIHKSIIGNRQLYDGAILPWNANKRTAADWAAAEHIFKPDIYIDAPRLSIAEYYELKGANYIQVEGFGLYHTGNDVLGMGVPKFECDVKLRIRSTKHIKDGIPTDITAGLQFNRKTLAKSSFCLDTKLPEGFTSV